MTEPVPGQTPEPPEAADPPKAGTDPAEPAVAAEPATQPEPAAETAAEPEPAAETGPAAEPGPETAAHPTAANPHELFGSLSLADIEADIDRLMNDKMSELDGMLAGLEELVQRLEGEITNLEPPPDDANTP